MNFDPVFTSNLVLFATALGGAFIAALWLSLIFWTYRDIRLRTRDRLARLLAAMVVAVLFLPGVLIYFILRPKTTQDEDYQRTLEENRCCKPSRKRRCVPAAGAG